MLTFRQLKTGAVQRASGYDAESCDFLRICRDAVRQLMNRGMWFSTVQPVNACVRDGAVTWPRGVSAILGINFCGHPVRVANQWFQFMQPSDQCRGWANDYSRNGWFGDARVETRNTAPFFNPIRAEGFVLRVIPTVASDVGKTITFYGRDQNNQEIFSTRPDGTYQTGIQVAMKLPYVDSPVYIRHVDRVTKDETDGQVRVYQQNVAGGFMLDFGLYDPTEISPEYIVTVLRGGSYATPPQNNDGNRGCCLRQVSALVKLEFVPFKFDDDLVQLDSEDAIRDMVKSIRYKDAGDITNSVQYERSALRELNFQMKQKYPDDQFIVNFRPFGRDSLNSWRVNIGQI